MVRQTVCPCVNSYFLSDQVGVHNGWQFIEKPQTFLLNSQNIGTKSIKPSASPSFRRSQRFKSHKALDDKYVHWLCDLYCGMIIVHWTYLLAYVVHWLCDLYCGMTKNLCVIVKFKWFNNCMLYIIYVLLWELIILYKKNHEPFGLVTTFLNQSSIYKSINHLS